MRSFNWTSRGLSGWLLRSLSIPAALAVARIEWIYCVFFVALSSTVGWLLLVFYSFWPRISPPASWLIVEWFRVTFSVTVAPFFRSEVIISARGPVPSFVHLWMASAMALLKIVAQLKAPTPRRVVDASVLVMAVFGGWPYRGGRHGFDNCYLRCGWWLVVGGWWLVVAASCRTRNKLRKSN